MPRPSNYVSRSDLGWGTSPASEANPQSGLVIHYDSADQGLPNQDHSACLTYWNNTRDFHTGPSRGWADIGYCADEETEILTEGGWRSFRQVSAGDTVLTLDHGTGTSQWQPVQAVNVFPATERTLIRLEGRAHSSLTTGQHRWPVERTPPHASALSKVWATTGTLHEKDLFRTAAPCAHLPDQPKWPDSLVAETAESWRSGTGSAPDHEFLRSLTLAQITQLLGRFWFQDEGWEKGRDWGRLQNWRRLQDRDSAEALQFAAVLSGQTVHLRCQEDGWSVEPDQRALLPYGDLTRTEERYGGHIWCPTTPNGTWLARRRGTVYFTGNSFMACAHGYVIEGRGLYRTQAAQPGGNSSHYSCTLATGPNDGITPEQINAVRALRQWLMESDASIAGTVLGHRDFTPTSCPGDRAYQMVQDGTFTQPSDGIEGDDMPRHRRFEKDDSQALEPGTWASLRFDRRHDDETGEFYALVGVEETDGAYYDLSVGVILEGVTPGSEVQIRATEYEPDGDGGWQIARNRPLDSPVHAGGKAHFTYSWKGNLSEGRRVRIRIAQFGDAEAHVTSATADVFYWPF